MLYIHVRCCALCTMLRTRKAQQTNLEISEVQIQELYENDNYKYLGVDESVGIDGPLNKIRVTREYNFRVKKIWNSQLNEYDKTIAHNAFVVPVLTPTIGILIWTKKEIRDIDIASRNMLTIAGGFHKASDIDRLYVERKNGGRGIRSIDGTCKIRTLGLMTHLEEIRDKYNLLKRVGTHEEQLTCRLGREITQIGKNHSNTTNIKLATWTEHNERWNLKETRRYLQKKARTRSDDR